MVAFEGVQLAEVFRGGRNPFGNVCRGGKWVHRSLDASIETREVCNQSHSVAPWLGDKKGRAYPFGNLPLRHSFDNVIVE